MIGKQVQLMSNRPNLVKSWVVTTDLVDVSEVQLGDLEKKDYG